MGDIIHPVHRSPERYDCRRAVVDTQILCDLVIGSLHKGTVDTIDRFSAICRNTGSQCDCGLFCDSHIHKLLACFFSLIVGKSKNRRCSGCNCHNSRIFLHFLQKVFCCNIREIFSFRYIKRLSRLDLERSAIMPLLFILLRRCISFSF